MFFLQATQAPVTVMWKGNPLQIPKYLLEDFISWGSEIKNARMLERTDEMEDFQRREFLAMYPVNEPDLPELRRLSRTPEGSKKIVETCLLKTGLSPEEQAEIMAAQSTNRMYQLAFYLADLDDGLEREPNKPVQSANPLSTSGPAGSPG